MALSTADPTAPSGASGNGFSSNVRSRAFSQSCSNSLSRSINSPSVVSAICCSSSGSSASALSAVAATLDVSRGPQMMHSCFSSRVSDEQPFT